jgi:hypothetical protein
MDETALIDPGCFVRNASGSDCNRPVIDAAKLSSKLSTVTKYDLLGNMIWCTSQVSLAEGAVSVKQTSDGGFICVGWGKVTRTRAGAPVYYNPTIGDATTDIVDLTDGCIDLRQKMVVYKIDDEGETEWVYQYGNDLDLAGFTLEEILNSESIGYDVIEIAGSDPVIYRVVGRCQDLNNTNGSGDPYTKGFVLDLDENGMIINKSFVGKNNYFTDFRRIIQSDTDPDQFFVTGYQINNSTIPFVLGLEALLFEMDENRVPVTLGSDSWYGGKNAFIEPPSTSGYNNLGWDVKMLNDGNLAWGFFSDCSDCGGGGYNNHSNAKIFVIDLTDDSHTEVDLSDVNTYGFSEFRAFDLKLGLTATADGGFAFLSSYRPSVPNIAVAPYPDILSELDDQISIDCLEEMPGVGFNPSAWNTDTYIAKFDATGELIWDKGFDSDPTGPMPYPGDYKQQECMYNITEADDGSLVFVGNTSHNKDDYYIGKINGDCGILKLHNDGYDISGYPGSHATVISTNTTWNTSFPGDNASLVGTVTVQAGKTLTIDGITMQFADSRKMDITTTIIVEQGAKLRLINGAKLTSITDCPNSMWDGVQVWGLRDEMQIPANQGVLEMDNATIENAIIGVSCVARYGYTKVPEYAGGILKITNSTFKNNLISVEMRPTRNEDVYGNLIDNASYIKNTQFLVNGPLKDLEIANATQVVNPTNGIRRTEPRAHQEFILLDGIQGMRIEGSDFVLDETYGNTIKLDRKGYGILAWNSSVKVSSISAYIGDPSPDLNNFENLWVGIYSKPMGETANSTISGSVFDNNHIGVAFDGAVTNSKIINNRFNVRENSVFIPGDADLIHANTGVYLRTATSTTIEQNVFDGIDQNNMSVNTGIYVEDSYALGGSAEIYRNSFSSFDVTIQSSDDNKQLFVDCNSFDNDITAGDVITWHNATDGLVPNQGECLVTDPQAPQANAFLGTYTGFNYQILNQGSSFDYSNFDDPLYTISNSLNVEVVICDGQEYSSNSCPNKTVSGDLPTLMSQISGLNYVITQLLYQIDTSTSNTDNLSAELSYYQGKKSKLVDYAVRTYLETNNYNSAITFLESQNSIESSCGLLPLLVQHQLDSKIDSTLTFIRNFADSDSTSQRSADLYAICDFYELIFSIHAQSGGIDSITNGQISQLQVMYDDNSPFSFNAGNVLEYLEIKQLDPLLLRPISTNSSQKPNFVPNEEIIFSQESNLIDFDLFPNPSTNEVTITFDFNDSVKVVIYDLTGRILYHSIVNIGQDRLLINLENYTKGVYLVQLTTMAGQSAVKKIILQ